MSPPPPTNGTFSALRSGDLRKQTDQSAGRGGGAGQPTSRRHRTWNRGTSGRTITIRQYRFGHERIWRMPTVCKPATRSWGQLGKGSNNEATVCKRRYRFGEQGRKASDRPQSGLSVGSTVNIRAKTELRWTAESELFLETGNPVEFRGDSAWMSEAR